MTTSIGRGFLAVNKTGIHVAQYITELPNKEIFEAKLKQVILIARENYAKQLIENI